MSIWTPHDLPECDCEETRREHEERQQLVNAAKAVGGELSPGMSRRRTGKTWASWDWVGPRGIVIGASIYYPATNNGDALWLASTLQMGIRCSSGSVSAQHRTKDGFTINSASLRFHEGRRDITECYREAILDVAAQIGERMP